MNIWFEDLLRFLTQNPNLGLLASALLTSTAVVCVAEAVALQLRRRSARARSIVWRIAMVALLAVGVWRLMPEAAPPVAVVEWRVSLPAAALPDEPAIPALVLPEKSAWQRGLMFLEGASIQIWLGTATMLLLWRVVRAWAGLLWLRRRSDQAPDCIQRLLRKMNAPDGMQCRVAQRLHSPMLSGWRRPVIWLPPDAARWDERRLGAVLRHELAHLQRADVAWHWLAQCTACLWWWQPLAWLAWRSLRNETEHAADDAAVLAGESMHDYARTLVEIAASLPSSLGKLPGVAMFGGESVQRRVRELMKASQWRGRIGVGALSMISLVAVILAVLAATKVEFKPQSPVYQSEARLVAGGRDDKTENLQAWRADFYGTITETLESGAMKRHALERIRALHPDLKDKEVEIHAVKIKDSTMFRVQALSEDRKYAQIFLDSLLDEFIAFRQSVREQSGGKDLQKLSKETAAAQKLMEEQLAQMTEFKRLNNLTALTTINNQVAAMLGKLQSQLEEQRFNLAELELTLRSVPAAMTMAQIKVSDAQPLTQTEKDYIQAQSELRRYENELKYLTENHKPEHPLLAESKEKVARARFLLNALIEPLREEMTQRLESTRSKVTMLEKMVAIKQQEALEVGTKIAQYDKLDRQAKAAKETHDKLYERSKALQAQVGNTDYVAIQERAKPATEVMQSGLLPVWKLWRNEPKLPAEDITPKNKVPVKAAS